MISGRGRCRVPWSTGSSLGGGLLKVGERLTHLTVQWDDPTGFPLRRLTRFERGGGCKR
jgi:hypothetical protein